MRVGELLITALYDGFVPTQRDPRTGGTGFLVEQNGRRILIDAGSGDSLEPDTGHLAAYLAAAGIDP
jgi:glyoxylase-like metal-dependent hydrolase (beta-lactamase superfamily II)